MRQPASPTSTIGAFATTAPGLEPVLARELGAGGWSGVRVGRSGVSFETDRHGLERACLTLRTAHRVLWTLGGVDASSSVALHRSLRDLVRWQGLIPPARTFAIDATARNNEALRDQRYVARVAKDAIVDAVRDATGDRPSVNLDDPDIIVRVSVSGRQGIVSLDASGRDSLHARGYRVEAGEAPLRETLAAGLIALTEWSPREALVDPMCGAGTLAIEAALIGLDRAPGLVARAHGGRYGFERWQGFKAERIERLVAGLEAAERVAPAGLRIHGGDIAPALVRTSRENADRAGVAAAISFARADALHFTPPAGDPGVIVANPPWGERLGAGRGTPEGFYRDFGAHLMRVAPGWRVGILAPSPREAEALGIPHLRWVDLKSGDLPIIACLGRIPRGGA